MLRSIQIGPLLLTVFVLLRVGACSSSGSSTSAANDTSCHTLPTTIRITKEEYDSVNQALMRVCEGDIRVTKCEGKCQSSLQPSFNSPTGFLKKCICCKEKQLRKTEFILNDCFDVNGNKLFGSMASMLVTMQEPDSCACITC